MVSATFIHGQLALLLLDRDGAERHGSSNTGEHSCLPHYRQEAEQGSNH